MKRKRNTRADKIKLASLTINPRNPRTISKDAFEKLCKSLREFPKMLELRPIVVDENNMILGGTQRYRAMVALGMTEIPTAWVKKASDLTEQERRRFIVVDNAPEGMSGENDFDILAADYNIDELVEWGFSNEELTGQEEDWDGPPEMECQPREHWDYVVFMFDKRSDWLQVTQKLGLTVVKQSEFSDTKIGLGRILKGKQLLELLSANSKLPA
jgi:hypothetical protein